MTLLLQTQRDFIQHQAIGVTRLRPAVTLPLYLLLLMFGQQCLMLAGMTDYSGLPLVMITTLSFFLINIQGQEMLGLFRVREYSEPEGTVVLSVRGEREKREYL